MAGKQDARAEYYVACAADMLIPLLVLDSRVKVDLIQMTMRMN